MLAERGHAEALLWVLAGNSRAEGFYRADGWLPDGFRRQEEIEEASDRLLEPFGAWPLPASHPVANAAERARTVATLVAGRPPVGFARIEVVDGHAHLGQLAVLPEYRRLGIGTCPVLARL